MKIAAISLIWSFLLASPASYSQDSVSIQQLGALPEKYYDKVSHKLENLEQQLDKKTEHYLNKIAREEEKLFKKMWKKDSVKAKELFGDVKGRYASLSGEVKEKAARLGKFSKVYSGKLDSLSTGLRFLDKNALVNDGLKEKISSNLQGIDRLQSKLDQSDLIKKYLRDRKKLLSEQLQKFGLGKELKRLNKQVYYYQQQVAEYKAILNDPAKLEEKLLGLLTRIPAFKEFFANNSQLGQLFRLPGATSNAGSSIAGLQTRASVIQDMRSRFGTGPQVQQMMQQNLQSAQGQLNELRNKASRFLPQGGSSDDELPDFKPNSQKTKGFWKRIELGTNFQNTRGNGLLPVTSDLGLSIGYKLNDRSVIGIGGSYKLGWGKDIQHIKISHQGAGIRSFIDWRLKGSFYLSGGYEVNYLPALRNIDPSILPPSPRSGEKLGVRSESGLLGLSKIISLNSKFFKKAKMQLMWDFLSARQVPRTQTLVFRIGYNFK